MDFFVLSFVLPCAYAYVASENQGLYLDLLHDNLMKPKSSDYFLRNT